MVYMNAAINEELSTLHGNEEQCVAAKRIQKYSKIYIS